MVIDSNLMTYVSVFQITNQITLLLVFYILKTSQRLRCIRVFECKIYGRNYQIQ